MRHINLTLKHNTELDSFMVTQESNNFGDQILSLKKLIVEQKLINGSLYTSTSYKVIATDSRQEGEWMTLRDMKNWLLELKKKKAV